MRSSRNCDEVTVGTADGKRSDEDREADESGGRWAADSSEGNVDAPVFAIVDGFQELLQFGLICRLLAKAHHVQSHVVLLQFPSGCDEISVDRGNWRANKNNDPLLLGLVLSVLEG